MLCFLPIGNLVIPPEFIFVCSVFTEYFDLYAAYCLSEENGIECGVYAYENKNSIAIKSDLRRTYLVKKA